MAIETQCPSCARMLRVPDELVGRNVKCPSCGSTFAASEGIGGPAAEPPMSREPVPGDDDGREPFAPPRPSTPDKVEVARSMVKAPAICMMIAGILYLLNGGYLILNGLVGRVVIEEQLKEMEKQRAQRNHPMGQGEREEIKRLFEALLMGFLIMGVASLPLGALLITASIRMLQLKSLGLARTAAILGFLPIACPSCALGIAFGIWALVILAKPEVTAGFAAATRPPY